LSEYKLKTIRAADRQAGTPFRGGRQTRRAHDPQAPADGIQREDLDARQLVGLHHLGRQRVQRRGERALQRQARRGARDGRDAALPLPVVGDVPERHDGQRRVGGRRCAR
jgi:hypothetical protein